MACHAVAAAISTAACAELGSLPHADGFTALPGLGARGAVDGHDVIVGREKLLRDCGLEIPAGLAAQCVAWERAGRTVVLAGWGGQARGAVAVADTIKPSAAGAVEALRRLGLRTILLTGAGFLNPLTAGAAMAASSVFVVGNSVRLRRFGMPAAGGLGPRLRHAAPVREEPADGTGTKEHTASCLE